MIQKKRIISILAATIILGNSSLTFANSINQNINKEIKTSEKQTKVKWTGSTYLTSGQWGNVTSSNNIFPDKPLVTNHANNPGELQVRILNSSGKQVGTTKNVKPGKSVRMDSIPAFSGTYTLQANPVENSGTYTVSID